MSETQSPRLATGPEVAALLRVSRRTVHFWIAKGILPPPFRVGGRLLFDLAEVERRVAAARSAGRTREVARAV